MNDVETRLQNLKMKQQDAQRRYAQAEAKLDQVRSQKAALLTSLKDQGFPDVAAARTRVQELSSQTDAILAEIEEKVSGL